jgi:hypothetical protein
MSEESQAIEVEVVEIDGIIPAASSEFRADAPPRQPERDWTSWRGQVDKLDARWWPLWVLLGTVVALLLLVVGVFLGIFFFIYRIIRGMLRAILR